ncbi:MAG: hypothetical protein ACWA5P_10220 [bacterium]
MNLLLIIRKGIFFILSILGSFSFAQENNVDSDSLSTKKSRYISYALGYNNPIPTGDNFIGQGLQGNGGFNFKVQIFVYKEFFVGASLGASYFNVSDQTVVGNYNKTRIAEQYLYVGYEFEPISDFHIGLTASVIGSSRYKNTVSESIFQRDSARLMSYGAYFAYEIVDEIQVYLDYNYRIDRTQIDVPNALESTFRRGKFHQIGLGIRCSFIGDNFITSLFKKKN